MIVAGRSVLGLQGSALTVPGQGVPFFSLMAALGRPGWPQPVPDGAFGIET